MSFINDASKLKPTILGGQADGKGEVRLSHFQFHRWKAWAFSYKGIGYKPHNEDRVVILPQLDAFAVIDGLGGPAEGDKAAQIVSEQLTQLHSITSDEVSLALRQASDTMRNDGLKLNSGVCLLVAWLEEFQLRWAFMGDVKLVVADASFHYKTETVDHSWINERLALGEISEQQALRHPGRNVVTRALTALNEDSPEFGELPLELGDRILIGTDGVWDNFTPKECLEMVAGLSSDQAAAEIRDACLEKMTGAVEGLWPGVLRSKPDNISLLAIELSS